VLTGTAAINGTGNDGDNVLTGNSAANVLNGQAGADTLRGLGGDDTYDVDNIGDVVDETSGGVDQGGNDLVRSSVSFTLPSFVERLELTGTGHIDATGSAGANTLQGNAGNNRLDGGAGADSMAGGAGDDVYVVDEAGDTVSEVASEGTDTVQSSISYTLGANVENLVLTGTAAINGAGNDGDNVLTGNSAANVLNGQAGADTLQGMGGDDTYVVDNAGDTVIESANAGTDTVQSSISYTLGANVERLVLTGTAAINGTGNDGDNVLTGNSAANVLLGEGGNDTLVGGGGVDTLSGGLGDDRLELNAVSNIGEADGGMGQDTLVLSTVGGALDLNALVGKVTNIERLELRDGAASNITLDAAAIQGMTDSRADLVLSLDSGDVLNIQSPYVVQGSGVDAVTGQSYTDYLLYTGTNPTATLHVYLPPLNTNGG
jgi:Ca2+-binding RTX toxin-like protein